MVNFNYTIRMQPSVCLSQNPFGAILERERNPKEDRIGLSILNFQKPKERKWNSAYSDPLSFVCEQIMVSSKKTHSQKMKNKSDDDDEGRKMFINVNLMGSSGPIRFFVGKNQTVESVIETAVETFARQGRLPVLGCKPQQFALYCPTDSGWQGNISAFSPSFFIASVLESPSLKVCVWNIWLGLPIWSLSLFVLFYSFRFSFNLQLSLRFLVMNCISCSMKLYYQHWSLDHLHHVCCKTRCISSLSFSQLFMLNPLQHWFKIRNLGLWNQCGRLSWTRTLSVSKACVWNTWLSFCPVINYVCLFICFFLIFFFVGFLNLHFVTELHINIFNFV